MTMPVIVQSKSTSTPGVTATSLNLSFDSNVTAGRLIVAVATAHVDLSSATLGDGTANSYTPEASGGYSVAWAKLWTCKTTVGGALTLTLSCPDAYVRLIAFEISNYDGTLIYDLLSGVPWQAYDSTNFPASPLGMDGTGTSYPDELFLAVGASEPFLTRVWGADTGWTEVLSEAVNGRFMFAAISKEAASAASTLDPTWTRDGSSAQCVFVGLSIIGGSAGGSGGNTGTVAATEGNDTSNAIGGMPATGTSAAVEAADTSSASGSLGAAISGSATPTEAGDTQSATGTLLYTGTSAASEANDTLVATGDATSLQQLLPVHYDVDDSVIDDPWGEFSVYPLTLMIDSAAVSGTAAPTEGNDTSAATGALANTIVGTVAANEAADSSSSSGVVLNAGSAPSMTEGADTASISGTVNINNVFGTVAAIEAADTGAANGALFFIGAAAAVEASDTGYSVGYHGTPPDPPKQVPGWMRRPGAMMGPR